MSPCDHVSWVGFVEGEAGPLLSYDWRLARVLEELQNPQEQYPHVILFMGTKDKDAALRQFCKGNCRRIKNPGTINLRADSNSLGSTYPRLYADCDPARCSVIFLAQGLLGYFQRTSYDYRMPAFSAPRSKAYLKTMGVILLLIAVILAIQKI